MAAVPLPIETERLLVRAFVPDEDAEAMLAVYGDPEVMRFIPGGPLTDLAAVRATLEAYTRAHASRGFSSWAIVERETGIPVGDVGFGVFEPTGDVELGYTLARACWGRGYATEAARACLAAGLAHVAVPRIVAVMEVANEASQRVAERIGMTRAGTVEAYGRPHALFVSPALSTH
jgi:RimJ/RimL family protein N-acetyltransferase